MLQFNNSMDVFRLLPKTNCKKCQAPTCLAFSVLVFKGDKQLNECPYIEEEIIKKFDGKIKKQKSAEQNFAEEVAILKRKIATIDLSLLANCATTIIITHRRQLYLPIFSDDLNTSSRLESWGGGSETPPRLQRIFLLFSTILHNKFTV